MEFYDVLKKRRSFRGYDTAREIPQDALDRIFEAVALAPTACNKQPFRFLLVRNAALRDRICEVYGRPWLKEAPAILVALGDATQAWTRFEGNSAVDMDVTIALEHFVLAAAAEGLGTCWICAFNRDDMDAALAIEKPWHSVAISPLGYARKDSCAAKTVKPITELIKVVD